VSRFYHAHDTATLADNWACVIDVHSMHTSPLKLENKFSFQNESIHAEKCDVKVNSEPRLTPKKILKIHCYYKNNM